MSDDPIRLFGEALERAREGGTLMPEAMALSTVSAEGRPSTRMVLLKDVTRSGFVFYTNLGSRKARDLQARPVASLCFHWVEIEEQVRVEGRVEPVSEAEADAYFKTRPRGSQIGAWASRQSETLPNRADLEARVRELEETYRGREVPRPPFWSGFLVIPERIELWAGRPDRLHVRRVFEWTELGWKDRMLYP